LILYELLTRHPFHEGKSIVEITGTTFNGIDARPSRVIPDVPPEIDAICVRATALEPSQRFSSARELADAVERYLDGDRDLSRRKELARVHAESSADLLERSQQEQGERSETLRIESMREVVHSLALDPEQRAARKTFVQLLVESPASVPPS